MSILWIGWAYKQPTGSVSAKAILIKIADNANDDGIAWPSIKTIAQQVELSPRAVQTNIRKLVETGLVRIEERHIGDVQLPNIYHLVGRMHGRRGGGGGVKKVQGGAGAADAGGVTDSGGGGGESPAPKPSLSKPSTESKASDDEETVPKAPEDLGPEFEEWYQHYPRKVARGQAEKTFETARRVGGVALEILIAGAKRYAAEMAGQEAQFIRYPSTWLNGKCWLDEPSPLSQTGLTWWQKRHIDESARGERYGEEVDLGNNGRQ